MMRDEAGHDSVLKNAGGGRLIRIFTQLQGEAMVRNLVRTRSKALRARDARWRQTIADGDTRARKGTR